jgi:hypothetical protein
VTSSKHRLVLGVLLALAAIACGGSDDPTDPNDPNANTGEFFMRMNIDGVWAAETYHAAVAGLGSLTFGGTKTTGTNPYAISFSLYNIGGTGSYPLGTGSTVAGGAVVVANALTAASTWITPLTGADGTLTIITLTADRIGGTFSFTVNALAGATGTKTATSGEFMLPFTNIGQGVALGPLPDNYGSKLSATIAGSAWNASNASGTYFAPNRVVTVQGSNNTRTFSLSINEVTVPGTYALNTTRFIGATLSVSPTQVNGWRSDQADGSGSVTITSLTATRMRGTFTATLGPIPGTGATGTLTITNGSFDIGLQAPPE